MIPSVSVIVPNYNHARYLRRRLDCILAQTYQDFELILLDDCSTDESREILSSYAHRAGTKLVVNERNSGSVFKQWNKGVCIARGRYIWIAESDDFSDNTFLARMTQLLDAQPNVALAYCRSWTVDETGQTVGYADAYLDRIDAKRWSADFVAEGADECRAYFTLCDPIPNSSAVLFRKEIYEHVGCANEGLKMCGDYSLWAAMALEGQIAYTAEPLNFYRTHRENVRTRTQTGALDVAEFFFVMLSILNRLAPQWQNDLVLPLLAEAPAQLAPERRIATARRSFSVIKDWQLLHNRRIQKKNLCLYLTDWEFALVGREFGVSPPSRWQFFRHRCRFYAAYFPSMNWRMRVLNLMRILGALTLGYHHRDWPEHLLAQIARRKTPPSAISSS